MSSRVLLTYVAAVCCDAAPMWTGASSKSIDILTEEKFSQYRPETI